MHQRQTVYILCGTAETNPNYTSWVGSLNMPYQIVTHLPDDWTPPEDAAVVVTHIQYRHREVAALRKSRDANIPVLVLADGILEYRNSWANPNLPTGAVFSPVIGHKLATIGAAQSRWVTSWGNEGVCEEVGLPRLDKVANRSLQKRDSDGEYRVLIVTARNPGFDDQQLAITRQSIADLRDWFERNPMLDGHRTVPIWRISPMIADDLNIDLTSFDMDANELVEVVDSVDAVITTPSTAMLESMIRGRPTALLDYHQVPHYVPASWLIAHSSQISAVMAELLSPPPAKMDFQQRILAENLQVETPAVDRLTRLVETMAEIGVQCQNEGRALEMPAAILPPLSRQNVDTKQPHGIRVANTRKSSRAQSLETTPPSGLGATLDESSSADSDRLRIELAFAEDSIKEKNDSIKQLQFEFRKANRVAEHEQTRRAALRVELKERKKELRGVDRQTKKLERQLTKSQSRANQSRRRANDHIKRIKRLLNQQAKLKRLIDKTKSRLGSSNQRCKKVETRRKTLHQRIVRLRGRVSHLERKTIRLRHELDMIEQHWFVGRCLRLARRFDSKLRINRPKNS